MSIRLSTEVWRRSRFGGTELLMLLAIADHVNGKRGAVDSYPSVATLAHRCRTSVRHANRILVALRESGELQIDRNAGPSGTNRYRITLPLTPRSDPDPDADVRATPDAHVTPDAGVTLTPRSRTPDAQVPKPLTPRSAESVLNRKEPETRARATRSKRAVATDEHPLFGRFYGAYPRKVARQKAAEVFGKIDPDQKTLGAMLQAIDAQQLAHRCAVGEERFVPHPATWLNQRRWTDEAPQASLGLVGASNGVVAL